MGGRTRRFRSGNRLTQKKCIWRWKSTTPSDAVQSTFRYKWFNITRQSYTRIAKLYNEIWQNLTGRWCISKVCLRWKKRFSIVNWINTAGWWGFHRSGDFQARRLRIVLTTHQHVKTAFFRRFQPKLYRFKRWKSGGCDCAAAILAVWQAMPHNSLPTPDAEG